MRIRVPAGTVIFFLLCAADFVAAVGSREGPDVTGPSPGYGYAIIVPASKAAVQINEFLI
jgi:hypothetical protein